MGFATVGELVAVLRYVSVEQKGLNQVCCAVAATRATRCCLHLSDTHDVYVSTT
jgi:hypothetical protein